VRRLASVSLAIGLIVSSLAMAPGAQPRPMCHRAGHACANSVLSDCCCQGGATATTAAASVFAETWSAVTRFHAHATSWLAQDPGVPHLPDLVAADLPYAPGSPPPLLDRESLLTVLLI